MHQDASRSRDLRPPCALQGSVGPTCSPRAVWWDRPVRRARYVPPRAPHAKRSTWVLIYLHYLATASTGSCKLVVFKAWGPILLSRTRSSFLGRMRRTAWGRAQVSVLCTLHTSRTRWFARTFTPHHCSHCSSQIRQQNPRQRKCMLDICITASSPSLAPRARARRQASARSGRERGRWTATLSNSAAGDPVCPPITRRAPLILAQRAAASGFSELPLSLSGVSWGSVQMKGNVEPRRCAVRRLFPKARTLILRCSSFKHCE